MSKDELIKAIKKVRRDFKHDPEAAHSRADDLLIEYIGDEDIKKQYDKVEKWYA